MNRKSGKLNISGVAATVLFAVFAVCILSLLLSGAGVYRRITAADDAAFNRRTASQYVITKLQSAPDASAVSVGTFGESDSVVIEESIDGKIYVTRIYCFDGWLRELWSAQEDELSPEAGEKILELESMKVSRQDELLKLELEEKETGLTALSFCLRGGEAKG